LRMADLLGILTVANLIRMGDAGQAEAMRKDSTVATEDEKFKLLLDTKTRHRIGHILLDSMRDRQLSFGSSAFQTSSESVALPKTNSSSVKTLTWDLCNAPLRTSTSRYPKG
jgi:hypothetical protein